MIEIDHVVHAVRDLDAAAEAWIPPRPRPGLRRRRPPRRLGYNRIVLT